MSLFGQCHALLQVGIGLCVLALQHVNSGNGGHGLYRVPAVLVALHQRVGFVVLHQRAVILLGYLVQSAEVVVAERYAQRGVYPLVALHRAGVVHLGRVVLLVALVDSSQVGIVDGLSQVAAQLCLSCQCTAEGPLGHLHLAQAQVYVAYAVERYHAVLHGRVAALVAIGFTQGQCLVVVLRSLSCLPYAPVVGTQVVVCLHYLRRVYCHHGMLQRLVVCFQCLGVVGAVAVCASQCVICHGQRIVVIGLCVVADVEVQRVGLQRLVHRLLHRGLILLGISVRGVVPLAAA